MLEFGLRQEIVMTIKAQRFTRQFHQELVRRGVRLVAGKTFTVFHWQVPGFTLG